METLEIADGAGDFMALLKGLSPPSRVIGQLLGHAQWSQDDLREQAQFIAMGRPGKERLRIWKSWEDWEEAKTMEHRMAGGGIHRPWSARDDADMRWILEYSAEIDAFVAGWRSLLTIESNHPMDLWINDANAVYFLAYADTLSDGDFTGATALTTQS